MFSELRILRIWASWYLDGALPEDLVQVRAGQQPRPADYSKFGPQSRMVMERSGMMSRCGELYRQLSRWVANGGNPAHITQYGISLAQLGGADRMGNVLFTGYYSPVLEVRHRPDAQYKYPIYAMPKLRRSLPDRAEIHRGAGQPGLELGYSKSLIDNFLMDVQGSGFVHYVAMTTGCSTWVTAARTATAMSALAGCSSTVAKCQEQMSMKAIKEGQPSAGREA